MVALVAAVAAADAEGTATVAGYGGQPSVSGRSFADQVSVRVQVAATFFRLADDVFARSRGQRIFPTMAAGDLHVDMDYTIMTVNSQIMYKPYNQCDDPEPDNDHEVYVGNLPVHYTIEKFVNFAK